MFTRKLPHVALGLMAWLLAASAFAAEETVDNPYGLSALWAQGDWVAKGTLLILVLMSMGSWYVIFTKLAEQSRVMKFAQAAQASFWQAGSVRQGADGLDADSPFRFIAEKGLEGASKHDGLLGHVDLNTWITMSIQRAMNNVQSRMQDGLAVLATVGSTAPFVGLFGTVWGIYNALVKIGMSGQASIDKVAGPVGESLIMTAIGLAVAVPAVLGYNWLVRRNKVAMEEVQAFGADLHAVLLGSAPKQAMAMHLGPSESDDELLTTINTTPLVDVMLVLLIIFLITIPVVTTSVKVDLPHETQQPRETQPDNIVLSIDAQGRAFFYDAPVRSNADLTKQLQTLAEKKPQPEVQIRGDAKADFEAVGRVLYAVQSAGLTKVRFVTEPQGTP